MTHSCVCNNCTSSSSKNYYSQQVCDSNGVTHNSRCELDREICLGNTNATWVHDGPCPREYPSQSMSKKQISLSHKPLQLCYYKQRKYGSVDINDSLCSAN